MTGTATRTVGAAWTFSSTVLVEAGFARRHLQLGLAGNAVDGAVEGEQHALVRGVHADEHRHAQHDAGRSSAACAERACGSTAS